MRKIFLGLITLMLLFGMASAVPNWGPPNGFHNKFIDADTITADVITAGVTVGDTGVIGVDTTWGDGFDILAASGTSKFDWSAATGIFKTSTGTNTLGGNVAIAGSKTFDTGTGAVGINGDVTIAAAKGITKTTGAGNFDFSAGTGTFLTSTGTNTLGGNTAIAGSKTFSTGTGAVTLNGPVGIAAGVDVIAASTGSDFDYSLSTDGIFKTPGGAVTIGPGAIGVSGTQTIASGKDVIAAGGASDIDFSLSSGILSTPTGTTTIGGATTWAANKGIAYTAGTGEADFSLGTGIFKTTTGAATIGPGAVGITGAATFAKTVSYSVNATTNTQDVTLTSTNTKTIYEVDASGGDVTITLPDAATVTGRMYMVAQNGNPGSYFARIKATAGKFGGANGIAASTGLKNTDDAGAGITLVSDGTNYLIVGAFGTWASG